MKKSIELLANLLFWGIIIYLLNEYLHEKDSDLAQKGIWFLYTHFVGFWYYFIMLFLTLIGPFTIFYLFYFVFIPKFLVRKKILWFVFLALSSSFLLSYLFRLTWGGDTNELRKVITFTVMTLICGIIGGAFKGFFLWRNAVRERKVLEKKNLENQTALLLLKAQLNPHFLFNSLNNIDILIEDSPKKASEYLRKLSDMLRYSLYETNNDQTELSKEIIQIENYLELQKIRTDNLRFVNFKVKGELSDQKVAPMIFLPFVENAFKYSKNKTIDDAINIEFDICENQVKMVCKNYYEPNHTEKVRSNGIGIETIKQRLNLLYPLNHQLLIDKKDNWFQVSLSLNIVNGN